MIILTSTFNRPDTSAPFYNDAPELEELRAARAALIPLGLASLPTKTLSEDQLTLTITRTFESMDAYRQYKALLAEIPNWPDIMYKYFEDHNHSKTVTMVDTYEN